MKPETTFGRSLGIIFIAITLNQELNSVRRMKNHTQCHLNTLTLSGARIRHWMYCLENRLDGYGNIDGGWDLSERWTRFTQFTILNEEPPDERMWSGRRLTKIQSTSKRLGKTPRKDHEDRIAGTGFNSLSHCNLVHKFIPMLQAMKILDARAALDKEWEKLEKIAGMANGESQEQKRGHSRRTERGKDSSYCYADGHMPPPELGVGPRIPKIQKDVLNSRARCGRRFWLSCCADGARFLCTTHDGRKKSWLSLQEQYPLTSESRRRTLKHRSKRPKIRLPRHGRSHGQTFEDPGASSRTKLIRTSLSRIVLGKDHSKKSSAGKWMGESTKLGLLICASSARFFPVSVRG